MILFQNDLKIGFHMWRQTLKKNEQTPPPLQNTPVAPQYKGVV